MTISRISVGSFHNVFNSGNQPSPGSFQIGDWIFIFTGENIGTDTISTPSGWTLVSPNSNAKQISCFGLQSLTGNETMPSISWGNQWAWAIVIVYRGLKNLTVTAGADRQGNTTATIVGPASSVTPPDNNSLVLFAGHRNSSGMTFTAPTNFTMVAQESPTNLPSVGICEWIQTTATTVAANTSMTGSGGTQTSQTMQGFIISFAPAPPAVVSVPAIIPAPGCPDLSSPRNPLQFQKLIGYGSAPAIPAPISGIWASSSVVFAPIQTVVTGSLGFIPQPGPGLSSPFNNTQFLPLASGYGNPSPGTLNLAGLFDGTSVFYGPTAGVAGQLNGIWPSNSTISGNLTGITAGTTSGLSDGTSAFYGVLTGIGGLGGEWDTSSTWSMTGIGGSFQPLIPMTAVVDVRLGIGYQPWQVRRNDVIG